ncbi:MAG: bifunctional diguanylate cyclase/phosphodiesterase, partial [Gammaproteobacteria bacterium]|nr:bifunctional diguanylate cyclase/phosphodiesterase [Gammaproteobacteria bacterium]
MNYIESADDGQRDPVTGLPTRYEFLQSLKQAATAAERSGDHVALLVLDVNDFQNINLTAGHATGDLVLREVAQVLRGELREIDTIGRLGDDEFAIILPSMMNIDHAILAVHKVLGQFDYPISLSGQSIDVRVSIGIAMYPDISGDDEQLLSHATMAMMRAKKAQTGFEIFEEISSGSGVAGPRYEGELRRVIEDGGLMLHYQAKQDLKLERITGVEALVRWPDPAGGFRPPDQFIPVAERSDLIHKLTSWVLNTALRQCAEWERRSLPLKVAVNLSTRSLKDHDLPDVISHALETWRVNPKRLTLEVTETAMMEEREYIVDVLRRLSDIGVTLSIDDFGSGYSSLQYLRILPVHELKIDKSFVMAMEQNQSDENIVRTVIELGRNFGLKITAEGVETERALELLKELGCDMGQGYFIHRPSDVATL